MKVKAGLGNTITKDYPLGAGPPISMGYPRSKKTPS